MHGYRLIGQIAIKRYLINPLLLDNATQPVLFHLFEYGQPVNALLPFVVESIRFYDDLNQVSGSLNVSAHLNALTQRDTNADVCIYDQSGQVLVEFRSINSRRITLDSPWRDYIYKADNVFLSSPVEEVIGQFADADITCRKIEEDKLPNDEGTLSWCADYVLSPNEVQIFETLPNIRRKREWLLGRIAAKEAVISLLKQTVQISLCCADIEIFNDEQGKPFCSSFQIADRTIVSLISITHKNGTATALAALSDQVKSLGIDLEIIDERANGFENMILSQAELNRFSINLQTDRNTFLTKIWSVKEAVGKALGGDFITKPKSLEILDYNQKTSQISVRPMVAVLAGDQDYKQVDLPDVIQANCVTINNSVLTTAVILQ